MRCPQHKANSTKKLKELKHKEIYNVFSVAFFLRINLFMLFSFRERKSRARPRQIPIYYSDIKIFNVTSVQTDNQACFW